MVQFPPQFPQLNPYQSKEAEKYTYPTGFPQPIYGFPNADYKDKTNVDQTSLDKQYWNGKVNLMKTAASSKTETHKWPIQPNPNGVLADPLNDKNNKDAENNVLPNLANNVRDDSLFNKQIPQNKVPQKIFKPVHKSNKQTTSHKENIIRSSISNGIGQN